MTIDDVANDLLDAFSAKLQMAVDRKVAELTAEVRKELDDVKADVSNANSLGGLSASRAARLPHPSRAATSRWTPLTEVATWCCTAA